MARTTLLGSAVSAVMELVVSFRFSETNSYDELAKKPIVDAEFKLNLFREATATSLTALEAYVKLMVSSVAERREVEATVGV